MNWTCNYTTLQMHILFFQHPSVCTDLQPEDGDPLWAFTEDPVGRFLPECQGQKDHEGSAGTVKLQCMSVCRSVFILDNTSKKIFFPLSVKGAILWTWSPIWSQPVGYLFWEGSTLIFNWVYKNLLYGLVNVIWLIIMLNALPWYLIIIRFTDADWILGKRNKSR